MLHLKLVKNAEDGDACFAALGSDGTCLTCETQLALYLLQVWAGAYPPRVVCDDSCFSSVSKHDALNTNCLKHIGVIKIAARKFPASHHDNCEQNERSDARYLVKLDDNSWINLRVMVWVNRDCCKFVSIAEGEEDHAEPIACNRWHQIEKNIYADPECVTFTIPQAKNSEDML